MKLAQVVGSGFSGLTTAYFLQKAGWDVEIFEDPSTAPLISTVQTEFGIVETAANGILNSALFEDLVDDIGFREEMVFSGKAGRNRYIFWGKPRRWPLGFFASLRVLLFLFKFWLLRWTLAPKPQETIRDWAQRVLGSEVAEKFLLPALQGIYGGQTAGLSAPLIVGRFFRTDQTVGGLGKVRAESAEKSTSILHSSEIPKNPSQRAGTGSEYERATAGAKKQTQRRPKVRGTVSFRNGMGQFTMRLAEVLRERGVRFISRKVSTASELKGDLVVVATGARSAAALAKEIFPGMERVELQPIYTVTLFFSCQPQINPGFGCLFPPSSGFPALGVLWNSWIFLSRVAGQAQHSETWITTPEALASYGEGPVEMIALSDSEIVAKLLLARRRLGGGEEQPLGFRVTRWSSALPKYTIELEKILESLPASGSIVFNGNYLGQIGLSAILERSAAIASRPS